MSQTLPPNWSNSSPVYIYMDKCSMWMCTYMCICVNVCVCVRQYVSVCAWMCVCACVSVSVDVHVYMKMVPVYTFTIYNIHVCIRKQGFLLEAYTVFGGSPYIHIYIQCMVILKVPRIWTFQTTQVLTSLVRSVWNVQVGQSGRCLWQCLTGWETHKDLKQSVSNVCGNG